MTRKLFTEPTTDPASGWATFDDLEAATGAGYIVEEIAAMDVQGFADFYAPEHHPWVTPAAEAVAR